MHYPNKGFLLSTRLSRVVGNLKAMPRMKEAKKPKAKAMERARVRMAKARGRSWIISKAMDVASGDTLSVTALIVQSRQWTIVMGVKPTIAFQWLWERKWFDANAIKEQNVESKYIHEVPESEFNSGGINKSNSTAAKQLKPK